MFHNTISYDAQVVQNEKEAPAGGTINEKLLEAAMQTLSEGGWDALSLQSVADRAGVSRVTAWRQANSKDRLVNALLGRLATDYRDTMWPILTASGTGAERLEAALYGLCEVADRHLPLLLVSDNAFHRANKEAQPVVAFTEPLVRLIRDGVTDKSLEPPADCETMGQVVFNTTCWSYVHLRGRHGWDVPKARNLLIQLILGGLRGPSEPLGRSPNAIGPQPGGASKR